MEILPQPVWTINHPRHNHQCCRKTLAKDEASQITNHLPITEENLKLAWDLLCNRYNNERRLVETYVKNILHLPNANGSAASLKIIHDITLECIRELENLKIDTKPADFLLNTTIQQKLDPETVRSYEGAIQNPRSMQNFNDLLTFIENRFQTLETIEDNKRAK